MVEQFVIYGNFMTGEFGIYTIFLESINEGHGVVEAMKTVVVVARKL